MRVCVMLSMRAVEADAKVTNSTQLASAMIVGSGAAHAIVNAVLKSGKDKMSSRALIDGFSALLMFPAAFFLPLPHGAWGWLAASAVVHLVYLICLIKSFESRGHERRVPDRARRGAGSRSGGRSRVLRRADQRVDRLRHRAGLQRRPDDRGGAQRKPLGDRVGDGHRGDDCRVHGHRCAGRARRARPRRATSRGSS